MDDRDGKKGLEKGLEKSRERFFRMERTEDLRQEANRALAERDTLLGAIFDASLDGMFIIDSAGRYVDVNPAGCEMFGYSREEILASDVRLLLFPEDVDWSFAYIEKLWEGGAKSPEYPMRRKDGARVWVDMTVTPFTVDGESFALGVKRDVTEMRREKSELLRDRDQLTGEVSLRTVELRETNAALTREVREREKAERALRAVLEGTANVAGEEYLRSLVSHLAEALGFRYVFVGEVTGEDLDSVTTEALWAGRDFAENFTYKLEGTPCETVVGKELCVYAKGIQGLFPEDDILVDMGAESYVGVPLFDSSGSPMGLLAALDVKPIADEHYVSGLVSAFASRAAHELERKRLEEEKLRSEDLLRALMDNAPAVAFIKDGEGRFLFVNSWYERYFNIPREEFKGRTDYDLFPGYLAAKFRANDAEVVGSGRAMQFEDRVPLRDGKEHTYLTVKFPVPSIPGAVCGIATDITERKEAEEELEKSEELLMEAQRIACIGNWDWDIAKDTLYWSGEIFRIFGLEPGEFGVTYEAFIEAVHPGDRDLVKDSVDRALHGGEQYSIDHRIVRPDGTERVVHEQAEVTFGPGGEPVRMAGIVQDITERTRAEEELRRSEERLREAQRIARVGSWEWDIGSDTTSHSEEMCRIFGRSAEELGGGYEGFLECVHPEDRDVFSRTVEASLASAQGYTIEYRIVVSGAGVRHIHEHAAVTVDKDGHPVRLAGTVQDITERKLFEEQALRARKLESVGELAGGIAHEFNNLLLGIIGNVSVAKSYAEDGSKISSLLDRVEDSANKTKALTRQLLTFSKGGEPVREACSVPELVRTTAALVLKDLAVDATFDFPGGLHPVCVDEGQMSQVISNVVLNAAQASAEGGVVRISAENTTACAKLRADFEGKECVRISVEDEGEGIPEESLSKIFDPFFTTREKASGLGLAVTYSIVRKHGGEIRVESEPGRGTRLDIFLPAFIDGVVEAASPVPAAPAAAQDESAGRPARVLMMDDEELVRDVAAEMLDLLGYESVFATEGAEAVEIYGKAMAEGRRFDAVIMDLTIPGGMGGVEAVAELLKIDPEARVIVSSGYSRDPIMGDYGKYGFKGVIKKPYRVADFSRVVREVIEEA